MRVHSSLGSKYPLGVMSYLVGGEAPPGKVGLDPPSLIHWGKSSDQVPKPDGRAGKDCR